MRLLSSQLELQTFVSGSYLFGELLWLAGLIGHFASGCFPLGFRLCVDDSSELPLELLELA